MIKLYNDIFKYIAEMKENAPFLIFNVSYKRFYF